MHFGEDKIEETDFTEESCFLDILKMCSRVIDIYSVGVKITYGDGMPLRNDKDLLALLREYEQVENIQLYLDVDDDEQPLLFKIPQGNPARGSSAIPIVPKVRDAMLLGDYKTNEKVIVCGDVVNGSEDASTVQFFIAVSKNFEMDPHMKSISSCMINKANGESGEPRYAVTEKCVADAEPSKVRKVREKNKNKKIAGLKPGEKLEINFYNNRAVGVHQSAWSRHLGKIVRNKNICHIRVKTWKDFSAFNKQHMWASVTIYQQFSDNRRAVKIGLKYSVLHTIESRSLTGMFKEECFFSPNIEFYCEHTLEHMRALWTSWRSLLNKGYVNPCKSKAEVLKSVPPGMNVSDWEWLVTNYFLNADFEKSSNLNSINRANRVNGSMPHRTGSRPHQQLIYEMGGNKSTPPDIAKIFMATRQKKGKFVEPEAHGKYDEILKTIQTDASLSQIEVVEKCFGLQQHSHVFGFGGGVQRKHFNDSQAALIKELQTQLHDKEEENNNLKRRMDGIECRMTQMENDNQPTSNAPPTFENDPPRVISRENST